MSNFQRVVDLVRDDNSILSAIPSELEFRNVKSRQFPLCCVKALGLLESEEEALIMSAI